MWDNTVDYITEVEVVEEDNSDNEDIISEGYNNLTEYVKLFNNGNKIDIAHFKNVLNNNYEEMEEKLYELENICENIWNEIMEPYINNQSYMILRNDKYRIKNNFFEWMRNNTNIGKKIDYVFDLFNDFENKSSLIITE